MSSTTNDDNNNKDKDTIENDSINSDDYFSNPLVSDTNSLLGGDELTKMVKSLSGGVDPTVNPITAAILGTKTTDSSVVSEATSDPFLYKGKLVRFGRFYITNVELTQNTSWPGYQDYYEDGRLMAFSITCNDPDIIPVCFVENAVGSKDVINDLSFKEAVWHGRGMTYGEATSTIRTSEGVTSRDVSGQKLTLFPYVARYKDQFTGTAVYEDIKNTIDDKTYVMNFEPNLFIPYQRLYFDVYNGSTIGTKLINRLEIKRLIYVDPYTYSPSTEKPSEFTQFNQDIQSLYTKINASKPLLNPTVTTPIASATASLAKEVTTPLKDKIYEDFIAYMYNKMNSKNLTKVDLTGQTLKIADLQEQQKLQDLLNMASMNNKDKPPLKRKRENKKNESTHDDVMIVKWD